MLRLLGKISVFGTQHCVEQLSVQKVIADAVTHQIGLSQKIPPKDLWTYATPWYEFGVESLNEGVSNFVETYPLLGDALDKLGSDVRWAILTLCPVGQSDEEAFSCLLNRETMAAITRCRLGLEIAPASVMPEAVLWKKQSS
jgi:hypothetical protein